MKFYEYGSRFRQFVRIGADEPNHPRGPAPFPEVRWTDRQEMWDMICKKERGMYLRQTGSEILGRHPGFMLIQLLFRH